MNKLFEEDFESVLADVDESGADLEVACERLERAVREARATRARQSGKPGAGQ